MTYQPANQSTSGLRSTLQSRGPGRPSRIEKARNPRSALIRLLYYLRPFKWALIFIFIFVLIYTILGLLGPYLMGVAIDRFIATKDIAGLVRIALLMLGAYLLNNLFQAIAGWIMA